MLHTMRQTMRFVFLTIGFFLFVAMAVHSAGTARDRQAVVGKPMLWLAEHTAHASAAGLNSDLQPGQPLVISTASSTDSTKHSQEVELASAEGENHGSTAHSSEHDQKHEASGNPEQPVEQPKAAHTEKTAKHN